MRLAFFTRHSIGVGYGLIDLDDLVQAFAYLGKKWIRQFFLRMNLCPAYPPVERFGLVTEDITGFAGATLCFGLPGCNGKGIVRIVFRRGHGQADDQRCFVVEITGRKDQKGMNIPHFFSGLGVAVDPDDILPAGRPGFLFFF